MSKEDDMMISALEGYLEDRDELIDDLKAQLVEAQRERDEAREDTARLNWANEHTEKLRRHIDNTWVFGVSFEGTYNDGDHMTFRDAIDAARKAQ